MTKAQMLKRALANRRLISKELKHSMTRIINSGAVDFSNEYNVKALTYAALRDVAGEWRPLSQEGIASANNMSRF